MNEQEKQKIIEFNNKFGIQTEFVQEEDILGYALNNTIYINENVEQDYEKTNKHELLHFFEDTPEFIEIKNRILETNKEQINRIRSDYELRYFGVYSEEEIQAGAIDNEIIIDIMTDNLDFEYSDGLKVGDRYLGQVEKNIEEKRYMLLTLKANIKNMNLSEWEKIFVANYYDGKQNQLPQGKDKIKKIKEDINNYLAELSNMDAEKMKLDPQSKEVIREFESEIKALKARGEELSHIQYLEENKEMGCEKIAEQIGNQLFAEYTHIVDLLKGLDYEPAFKALMLQETLSKTYKLDTGKEKENTIIKKRNLNESIAQHMILNEETMEYMYNNVGNLENYDRNFSNLYFDAVQKYNEVISEKSQVTLDGVDDFGKGKWMRFKGRTSDEANYIKNAKDLAALVQNTPWCTKQLASSQLASGDFYVFVDNENKPHIAVRMQGNTIGEVRGVKGGDSQELEDEYRDVAISFLENNKDVKNGKEWLEKEEWNKRLIEYKKSIEEGTFQPADAKQLLDDYFRKDYRSHDQENSNIVELRGVLHNINNVLAEYFGCKEDEFYAGDLICKELDTDTIGYKVVLGNVDFSDSEYVDTGKLEEIYEDVHIHEDTNVKQLTNLKKIRGSGYFSNSKLEDISSLEYVGNNLECQNIEAEILGNTKYIGGTLNIAGSKIKSLGSVEEIGENLIIYEIEDDYEYYDEEMDENIEVEGHIYESILEDTGELKKIGGRFNIHGVPLKSLGKIEEIGDLKIASKLEDTGALRKVKRNLIIDFAPELESLSNIEEIGEELRIEYNFLDEDWVNPVVLKDVGALKKVKNVYCSDYLKDELFESLLKVENIGYLSTEREEYQEQFDKIKQEKQNKNHTANEIARATKDLNIQDINNGNAVLEEAVERPFRKKRAR